MYAAIESFWPENERKEQRKAHAHKHAKRATEKKSKTRDWQKDIDDEDGCCCCNGIFKWQNKGERLRPVGNCALKDSRCTEHL